MIFRKRKESKVFHNKIYLIVIPIFVFAIFGTYPVFNYLKTDHLPLNDYYDHIQAAYEKQQDSNFYKSIASLLNTDSLGNQDFVLFLTKGFSQKDLLLIKHLKSNLKISTNDFCYKKFLLTPTYLDKNQIINGRLITKRELNNSFMDTVGLISTWEKFRYKQGNIAIHQFSNPIYSKDSTFMLFKHISFWGTLASENNLLILKKVDNKYKIVYIIHLENS